MSPTTPIVVPLAQDFHGGVSINAKGWTGAAHEFALPDGVWHFQAVGGERVIAPGPGDDAAVHLYPGCKHLVFDGWTIEQGRRFAVSGGTWASSKEVPMSAVFKGCRFRFPEVINPPPSPFWGVSLTQSALRVADSDFKLGGIREHCIYARNVPGPGLVVLDSHFGGCGGQHIKRAGRDTEGPQYMSPTLIRNCTLRDHGQDPSRRSTAIDLSGPGGPVEIVGGSIRSDEEVGAIALWNGGEVGGPFESLSVGNVAAHVPHADRPTFQAQDIDGDVQVTGSWWSGPREVQLYLEPGRTLRWQNNNRPADRVAAAARLGVGPDELINSALGLKLNGELLGPLDQDYEITV